MSTTAARVVGELPLLTRTHILEEADRDPRFWRYLANLARAPYPGRRVDDEMKKVLVNELDPSRFKETRGTWPVLREKLRTMQEAMQNQLYATGSLEGFGAAAADTLTSPAAATPNIWSTIGSAITAIGSAAANIYTTKITTSAQTEIAKQQAQVLSAQQAAAAQPLAPQYGVPGMPGGYMAPVTVPVQEGTPVSTYVMYALLGLLGVGGLILLAKAM
jgi:hypothetical protein